MSHTSRLFALSAVLAAGVCCEVQPAQAQNLPTKPIRWVLGPAPDVLPRLVSQKLAQLWGQQVMIAAGHDLADTTIAEFDAFVRKDIKLYERIIKDSKIKLDQ